MTARNATKGKKESVLDILERLQQQSLLASDEPAESVVEVSDSIPKPHKLSARGSRISIEQFNLDLFSQEVDGRFVSHPITPGAEFPTFLTRIPIFLPMKRGRSLKLDQDNALPFVTSWGRGRKHGPPLTVYDEDTLMAIARLRKNRLEGSPSNMPIPLSAIQPGASDGKGEVSVHVLGCSLSDIQHECGDSDGGTNLQLRLASIKRLGATVLEFDRETKDKLSYRGTQVKLVDVAWDVYEENALLLIQFSPLMAIWLESEYTYINWSVRKQLSDTGKALHRFLSAQPKTYSIFTEKLSTIIGFQRPYRYFMSDLRTTLTKLEELGWIASWEITGTGRRVPHKLTITR